MMTPRHPLATCFPKGTTPMNVIPVILDSLRTDPLGVADLDASLLEQATGRRWILSRRPDLYKPLAVPTGKEVDTRILRFDKKGI